MKLDPDERGNGEESPTIPAPQGDELALVKHYLGDKYVG
jgi:hypothetical protein